MKYHQEFPVGTEVRMIGVNGKIVAWDAERNEYNILLKDAARPCLGEHMTLRAVIAFKEWKDKQKVKHE